MKFKKKTNDGERVSVPTSALPQSPRHHQSFLLSLHRHNRQNTKTCASVQYTREVSAASGNNTRALRGAFRSSCRLHTHLLQRRPCLAARIPPGIPHALRQLNCGILYRRVADFVLDGPVGGWICLWQAIRRRMLRGGRRTDARSRPKDLWLALRRFVALSAVRASVRCA